MVSSSCLASWALLTVSVVQGRTRINVKLTEKDGEVTDLNFSGFEVTPSDWERFVNDSLTAGPVRHGVRQRQSAIWRKPGSLHRLDDAPAQPVPVHHFDSSRDALVAA